MKKKLVWITLGIVIGLLLLQIRRDVPAAEVEKQYALKNSSFITIQGQRTHYSDRGAGETVLLLHGTAASLHTWEKWTATLADHFRVVSVDLPAFGLTGPAPTRHYDVESYVQFVDAFLDQLKIRQLYIAGNSLGGHIAWRFAVKNPDRVNKLILIDSAGLPRIKGLPFALKIARTPVLKNFARVVSPRFLVKKSLKEVYFDSTKVTDELVDRYYAMALREGNRQAFVDRAEQMADDTGAGLETLRIPVLIMWGRHDRWIPIEQAENFRKKILLSQVKIYENAGHIPHEEIPEQTVADALKFLK